MATYRPFGVAWKEDVAEIVPLLCGLLGIALFPLIGFAVVSLARRRPGTAATLLGVVTAAGVVAIRYAAAEGFGFRPDLHRVVFGSEAGRWCFDIGLTLLTLGGPAWLLFAIARTPNGTTLGPVGPQWVMVLFGYWMACLIFGTALYSLFTGYIK